MKFHFTIRVLSKAICLDVENQTGKKIQNPGILLLFHLPYLNYSKKQERPKLKRETGSGFLRMRAVKKLERKKN